MPCGHHSATLKPWRKINSLPACCYLWLHYLWEDSEGAFHPYPATPQSEGRIHWRCWSGRLKQWQHEHFKNRRGSIKWHISSFNCGCGELTHKIWPHFEAWTIKYASSCCAAVCIDLFANWNSSLNTFYFSSHNKIKFYFVRLQCLQNVYTLPLNGLIYFIVLTRKFVASVPHELINTDTLNTATQLFC